jgi:SNF2 family DNA or RNA helicase
MIYGGGAIHQDGKPAPGILELWQQGARQIVFSQFATGLEELEKRLHQRGMRVARLDGSTPKKQRDAIKADFDRRKLDGRKGKYDIILAQYRSGGTGLNFTAVTETHILDEEWSPGKKTQAYGRSHRIGQTETSRVWVYRMRNTIDQWLANLINGKKDMITEFETGALSIEKNDLKNGLIEAMKNGEIL